MKRPRRRGYDWRFWSGGPVAQSLVVQREASIQVGLAAPTKVKFASRQGPCLGRRVTPWKN